MSKRKLQLQGIRNFKIATESYKDDYAAIDMLDEYPFVKAKSIAKWGVNIITPLAADTIYDPVADEDVDTTFFIVQMKNGFMFGFAADVNNPAVKKAAQTKSLAGLTNVIWYKIFIWLGNAEPAKNAKDLIKQAKNDFDVDTELIGGMLYEYYDYYKDHPKAVYQ